MKYSYVLFFFFLSAAHAQQCPSISGTFNCQSGTEPYNIQVQTQESGYGAAHYTFQSPAQGVTEFIADGQEQSIKTTSGPGFARGICKNGRLVVDFNLTNDKGQQLSFTDEMYMERGALVRIRSEGAKPTVFVCRPVFARPRP
jgi:hypothetical protein